MLNHKPIKPVFAVFLSFLIIATPARAYNIEQNEKDILTIKPVNYSVDLEMVPETNFKRLDRVRIEQNKSSRTTNRGSIQLTSEELISILREVGFSGDALKMAWAIVMLESNGRPYAHNDNASTGDNSYGIFQINMKGSMGPDRRSKYGLESNKDLFDPITNAKIAFHMSNGGTTWGAWTTQKKARGLLDEFPG